MFASVVLATAVFVGLAPAARSQVSTASAERVTTLANGLKVVVVENHLAPIVDADMFYYFGSSDETAGKTGLAHALEHMMFRGTREVSYAGLTEFYAHFGGRINARTNEDFTQFYATVPTAALPVVLRLEADRMANLALRPQDWTVERGAVLNEIEGDLAAPLPRFIFAVRRAALHGTPYELETMGLRDDVARATVDDLRRYYSQWYGPNNATLVVVGDVKADEVIAQAQQAFGAIPRRAVPQHASFTLPKAPAQPQTVSQTAEFPFEIVDLAYPIPSGNVPDTYALQNLAYVIDDERSPFYRALVESGLTLAAFTYPDFHERAGILHVMLVLSPGKSAAQAQGAFDAVLAATEKSGFPADIVGEVRAKLVAENTYARDSLNGFATELGHLYGISGISLAKDTEMTGAVTASSVTAAAVKYLAMPAVVGVLKPNGTKVEGLTPPSGSGVSDNFGARIPDGEVVLPEWVKATLRRPIELRSAVDPARLEIGGADVLVQPVPGSSTVLIRGEFHASPTFDPPGREGLFDFTTAMLGYGSKQTSFEAMQRRLGSIGAELQFGSHVTGRALSKDFETLAALLGESLREPAFPQKFFETNLRRERDAVAQQENLPQYRQQKAFFELLLPKGDPELREPSPASLGRITRDEVAAEARKYVRPENLSLSIVGDVTSERVRQALEAAFAGWKGEGPNESGALPPIPQPAPASKLIPTQEKVVQVEIGMAGVPRGSRDYDALSTATKLLGGAMDSRLMTEMRIKRGLVYDVEARVVSDRDRGMVRFRFSATPQNVRQALAILKREVERLGNETPGDYEITGVKRAAVSSAFVKQGSFSEVADDVLKISTDRLPRDYYPTLERRLSAVTPLAVQIAARRYLSPAHWIEVYSGPTGW